MEVDGGWRGIGREKGEMEVDGGWRGTGRGRGEEGGGGGGTEGNREGERREEREKGKGVQMKTLLEDKFYTHAQQMV